MTLAYSYYILLRVILYIALSISILFCYRGYNPTYLRLFPIYHLLACGIETIVDLFYVTTRNVFGVATYIPYNIFTLLEFFFFFYFLSTQIKTKRYKLFLHGLGIMVLITLIALVVTYQNLSFPIWAGTMPTNIFYIVGCLLYFLNISSEQSYSNLSKEPSFWIISGLFLYSIVETPTLVIVMNYKSLFMTTVLYVIVNETAYLFLNLFFIKAYTCKIRI